MYSSRYLSRYCLFTVAVVTFRSPAHPGRDEADTKAVANAFKRATTGMSKSEQASFIEYLRWLIDQPRRFEIHRLSRSDAETALDYKLGKRGSWLIDDGSIMPVAEFIERTGMSQEELTERVRNRKLFKMPHWVDLVWSEEYYPAFFADLRYDPAFLEATSQALGAADGIRKFRFFTTPDPELDNKTPVDILAGGDLGRVLVAAKRFRRLVLPGTGLKND